MNKYIKLSVFVGIGLISGYIYYYFFGCKSGCPIKSNSLLTTLYGGILGLVAGFPKPNKKNNNKI